MLEQMLSFRREIENCICFPRCGAKINDLKYDCESPTHGRCREFKLTQSLLIPLLADLINTKYFVTALNFQNDCIGSDSENAYTVILDGVVAKEHLHGMDNNYKAWRAEKIADRVNTVPVNVLLMDFYDGSQLFHCKTCESWCFLISIYC